MKSWLVWRPIALNVNVRIGVAFPPDWADKREADRTWGTTALGVATGKTDRQLPTHPSSLIQVKFCQFRIWTLYSGSFGHRKDLSNQITSPTSCSSFTFWALWQHLEGKQTHLSVLWMNIYIPYSCLQHGDSSWCPIDILVPRLDRSPVIWAKTDPGGLTKGGQRLRNYF